MNESDLLLPAPTAKASEFIDRGRTMKTSPDRSLRANGAKLLIIHADDLGMAHAVNVAAFNAYEAGHITSGSVMIPCGWLPEVAAFARANPDFDLGVHLTLTSEWSSCRWGPVAPKHEVSSLLDPDGYFWPDEKQASRRVRKEEVEVELRAQVERALQLGIRPTHLDSHMMTLFTTLELRGVFSSVARAYGIPTLQFRYPETSTELPDAYQTGEIVIDRLFSIDAETEPSDWARWYRELLLGLEPGLNQLIVHPGLNTPELEAMMGSSSSFGAEWRERDSVTLASAEFQEMIEALDIKLVGWNQLQENPSKAPLRRE